MEHSAVYRVLVLLQPLGILLAVVALLIDLQGRQDARSIAAWQLITTPASGNSGKITALEYLNRKNWFGLGGEPYNSLRGIDMRPPPGGKGAYLADVDLSRATLHDARFDDAILDGAIFDGAFGEDVSFEGAQLIDAPLQDTLLNRVNFRNANLAGAHLDRLQSDQPDFTDAFVGGASFVGMSLFYCRCSGMISDTTFSLEGVSAEGANFWGGSLAKASLEFEGQNIFLRGVDVSGANIRVRDGARLSGYAWALDKSRPIALPLNVTLVVCSSDETWRSFEPEEEGEAEKANVPMLETDGEIFDIVIPEGCEILDRSEKH